MRILIPVLPLLLLCQPSFAQSAKQICGNKVSAEVIRQHYCKEFRATPLLAADASVKAAESKCIQLYAAALDGVGLICEYVEDVQKIAAEANSGNDGPTRAQDVSTERAVALYAKLNRKYIEYFPRIAARKQAINDAAHGGQGSKKALEQMGSAAREQFKKESECNPSAQAGQAPALLLAGLAAYSLSEQLTVALVVEGRLEQLRRVVESNYVGSVQAETQSRRFLEGYKAPPPSGGNRKADPGVTPSLPGALATRLAVQGSVPTAVANLPEVKNLLTRGAGGLQPVPGGARVGPVAAAAVVSLGYRLVVQGELDVGDFISIGAGVGASFLGGPWVGLAVGFVAQVFETAIRGRLPGAYRDFAGKYLRANTRADSAAVSRAFHESTEKKQLCGPVSGAPRAPQTLNGRPIR